MDNSTITDLGIYREEKFRAPSPAEKQLGLWVDRIGKRTTSERPQSLRVLGQYCHIYVVRGCGVYLSEAAGEIKVNTGDCMLQFPEDPCLYYPHGTWTTCWVTWNGPESRVMDQLGYISPENAVFPDPDAATLYAYDTLKPIIHYEDIESALNRKIIVLDMIRKVCSVLHSRSGSQKGNEIIKEAIAWLHDHFNENIKIPRLASNFHLSETHFRRSFRTYTGSSPIQFITSLRIAQSKRLLREHVPMKQVAEAVGYRDVFYFMRIFKKVVGVPPGEFKG